MRSVVTSPSAKTAGGVHPFLMLVAFAACSNATDPSARASWESEQVTRQDTAVVVEQVTYRSSALVVRGVLCHPTRAGRYPTIILNHGGWSGLGTELNSTGSVCAVFAQSGYVIAEPSYRGEDTSQGTIEMCLGEAEDVARMLTIVRALPYVDSNRIGIIGGSHGGCITLRSLTLGIVAPRAVAVAGPTDWAGIYAKSREHVAHMDAPNLAFHQLILATLDRYVGGSPEQVPQAYADRSLLTRAGRIAAWDGRLLIQHGVEDDIVPVGQSCALAALIGNVAAYHIDYRGEVVAAPPAACVGATLTWRSDRLPTDWPARHYLVVYDSLDHGFGLNLARQNTDALSFLLFP